MEACKNCKYGLKNSTGLYFQCRRNPPRVVTDPRKPALFPLVEAEDFCGEFKPR
jgi:hypothetical protein